MVMRLKPRKLGRVAGADIRDCGDGVLEVRNANGRGFTGIKCTKGAMGSFTWDGVCHLVVSAELLVGRDPQVEAEGALNLVKPDIRAVMLHADSSHNSPLAIARR